MLFGGLDASLAALADTWEYDGTDWRSPTVGSPGPRTLMMFDYDRARARTLLLGGNAGQNQAVDDQWEYDGVSWARITAGARPRVAMWGAMAFDDLRGRHVLFGGLSGYQVETWETLQPLSATFARTGPGCPGSGGQPSLDPVGGAVPTLGSVMTLRITGLQAPAGFVFLAFGFDRTSFAGQLLPLSLAPLGMPACTLWIAPEDGFLLAHGGSAVNVALAIPNVAALRDVGVDLQALDFDPAAAGGFGATTNAAQLFLR